MQHGKKKKKKRKEGDSHSCYSEGKNLEDILLKEIRHWFHSLKYQESSDSEKQSRMIVARGWGGGISGWLLFNGYRVSVLWDEKVAGISCTTMCMCLALLNHTLKKFMMVNFVICISPQFFAGKKSRKEKNF